jgi:transposase InsO family protein
VSSPVAALGNSEALPIWSVLSLSFISSIARCCFSAAILFLVCLSGETLSASVEEWIRVFIFDRTSNGRSLKILSLIDEYTRECIALEVSRRFTGDDLVDLLADVFSIRGVPEFIRSDNGPEFISRRVREFLERIDIGTSFIQPGSPWENGYVESFHSRFRDECLSCEEFTKLHEAQEIIGQWRSGYNHHRPQSSLSGLTPAEFAAGCSASTPVTALTTLKRNNERYLLNQTLSS